MIQACTPSSHIRAEMLSPKPFDCSDLSHAGTDTWRHSKRGTWIFRPKTKRQLLPSSHLVQMKTFEKVLVEMQKPQFYKLYIKALCLLKPTKMNNNYLPYYTIGLLLCCALHLNSYFDAKIVYWH